jgi:hypothetical protein
MSRWGVLASFLVVLAVAPVAGASEPLPDKNVRLLSLKVNAKGEALITYVRSDGSLRRALVWGGVDARHPDPNVPQVRFRYDLSGGWGTYRRLYWRTFRNVCRRYAGPFIGGFVTGCTAPDGSHWALQAWVRRQPLLGFDPWLPEHTAVELHVSHWTGPLAELEISPNWTYGFSAQGVFGRLTYLGQPVYGFGTTREGNPRDRYVRNVYIDTFNSVYGPGWKRESGIVTHRPTGTFCHSFVPQQPFPGYPDQRVRPGAPGERYRVSVMGPGVTPVITWEGPGLSEQDKARDGDFDALFDRVMAGDGICASER